LLGDKGSNTGWFRYALQEWDHLMHPVKLQPSNSNCIRQDTLENRNMYGKINKW